MNDRSSEPAKPLRPVQAPRPAPEDRSHSRRARPGGSLPAL